MADPPEGSFCQNALVVCRSKSGEGHIVCDLVSPCDIEHFSETVEVKMLRTLILNA